MPIVDVVRSPLQVVSSFEAANDLIDHIDAGDLAGFVLDASALRLAIGTPEETKNAIQQNFGPKLASLGLLNSSVVNFTGWHPEAKGLGLHVDGDPRRAVYELDSLNFHATSRGRLRVDLVRTKPALWTGGWNDVPTIYDEWFREGSVPTEFFGPVLSAEITAPAIVIHQFAGKNLVAHSFQTIGNAQRDSISVSYSRKPGYHA